MCLCKARFPDNFKPLSITCGDGILRCPGNYTCITHPGIKKEMCCPMENLINQRVVDALEKRAAFQYMTSSLILDSCPQYASPAPGLCTGQPNTFYVGKVKYYGPPKIIPCSKGEKHDGGGVQCDEGYPVFEKIEDPASYGPSFLIIRDSINPAGYFKLQLVLHDKPSYIWAMSADENFIKLNQYCEIDKCRRIVLHKIIHMSYNPQYMCITENKPAVKVKNFYGASLDDNRAYRCTKWPTFAQEWISRKRFFGWPTNSMVQQLPLLGFFVVKKRSSFVTRNKFRMESIVFFARKETHV
ncbi:unnamed protein product [Mytilus coruscus]|uniref:Uncharacterized protein n=1 Tax=Mytilus coruscus TaxID=42192 RepID=A0A6J8APL1_MYTCO|nr:unnamed protein product [Mytilus coruscus]